MSEHRFGEIDDQILEAKRRIGWTAVEQMRWILREFVNREDDVDALTARQIAELRYEVIAFFQSHINMPPRFRHTPSIQVANSEGPIKGDEQGIWPCLATKDQLRQMQSDVRELLSSYLETQSFQFGLPESGIHYFELEDGQAAIVIELAIIPAFRLKCSFLLLANEKHLRRCGRSTCARLYVPEKGHSKYCSERCGSYVRQQRFQAKRSLKQNLKPHPRGKKGIKKRRTTRKI